MKKKVLKNITATKREKKLAQITFHTLFFLNDA